MCSVTSQTEKKQCMVCVCVCVCMCVCDVRGCNIEQLDYGIQYGTRQNAERGGSPLVSFDHVIDPYFVTCSSSLYTTICNPKRNPNSSPNPNVNPTVITDPQVTL